MEVRLLLILMFAQTAKLRREPCASGPHPTCWGLIPSQGRLCARQVPKVVFPGHAATSDMDSHMQEQGKQRRPEADL